MIGNELERGVLREEVHEQAVRRSPSYLNFRASHLPGAHPRPCGTNVDNPNSTNMYLLHREACEGP